MTDAELEAIFAANEAPLPPPQPEVREITLHRVRHQVDREDIAQAAPLNPAEVPGTIVVVDYGGSYELVDGLSRVAGMFRWARARRVKPKDVRVRVVVG